MVLEGTDLDGLGIIFDVDLGNAYGRSKRKTLLRGLRDDLANDASLQPSSRRMLSVTSVVLTVFAVGSEAVNIST